MHHPRILLALAAVAGLASAAGAGCAPECSYDTDCAEGRRCAAGSCEELDADGMSDGGFFGSCASDATCPAGDACYRGRCLDATLVPDPATCPSEPLAELLICSDWDKDECPCYAGIVNLREKEVDGRLSCAGITADRRRLLLRQSGCHLSELRDWPGGLSADAVGFDTFRLHLEAMLEGGCSAQPDRWIPEGATDGGPAVRVTCSASCTFWIEQLPAPAPERVVPDGRFPMGTEPELVPADRPDEGPRHEVDVSCFYMDRFEVSRGEYQRCLATSSCSAPELAGTGEDAAAFFAESKRSLPMTFVTQAQARAFCSSLQKALPTEAEWERAARSSRWSMGSYPWGDAPPFDERGRPDCKTANFAGCGDRALPVDNGGGDTVRQKGTSHFDVVDLGGNVAEWTRDFYVEDAYRLRAASSAPPGVARNPEQRVPGPLGEVRVVRGGSFRSAIDPELAPPGDDLRAQARSFAPESAAREDLGFRCVRYRPGVAR